MELRGGCGYIEDFVNPRLVRDAYLGSIWEGTSNIIAIDAIRRAVGREGCLAPFIAALTLRLDDVRAVAPNLAAELGDWLQSTEQAVADVAAKDEEAHFRSMTSALYHIATATLMAWEGAQLAQTADDASRLLWARLALDHRVISHNKLKPPAENMVVHDMLLRDVAVPSTQVSELLR